MKLRDIPNAQPLYAVPGEDLVGELLIPALSAASAVRCMTGFFASSAFRHIAPGLAAFINGRTGTFRLLISPRLEDADREAILAAVEDPAEVLIRTATLILNHALISESALERHVLQCLSYLLAAGRLDLRFVLMASGGMFHPKVWIFDDGRDCVVAHGSSNVTPSGLLFNFETVSIERSWTPEGSARTTRFIQLFETLWRGEDPDTLTIDLPAGIDLVERAPHQPPTIDDFWRAWHDDYRRGLAPPLPPGRALASPDPDPEQLPIERLQTPPGLVWQDGPFAHQGRAVHAWEASGGRGLLSMATGSGKTVASLICATRLQESEPRLLVIIAAPYRPLVEQWRDEVGEFGVHPLRLSDLSAAERDATVREAVRRLDRGVTSVEVAVVTHDYLVSDGLHSVLEAVPPGVATLLIADEVHNLGRPRFVIRPPERFNYRLGLSATPVLQYNEEGTEAIARFFGATVFEFGLAEAIGVCLVPYNYYIHPVPLGLDELEVWDDLTQKLLRAGYSRPDVGTDGDLSPAVLALLVKRRAVLEAAAAKLPMLRTLLLAEGIDAVRHTLVYCTDKRPEQLLAVNRELVGLGLFVRQLTAEETVDRQRTAEILEDFARGDYQVITCKRVLDEGVDLPQVRQAFLMASNSVRRQWIQRRGRILRRCDAVGKQLAHLHDFIVVPPDTRSPSGRSILRQELDRARAFAELAANAGSPDGPFVSIGQLSEEGGLLTVEVVT